MMYVNETILNMIWLSLGFNPGQNLGDESSQSILVLQPFSTKTSHLHNLAIGLGFDLDCSWYTLYTKLFVVRVSRVFPPVSQIMSVPSQQNEGKCRTYVDQSPVRIKYPSGTPGFENACLTFGSAVTQCGHQGGVPEEKSRYLGLGP